MSLIKDVKAREILDSRGLPTIEVDLVLSSGVCARASVPSGKSTGTKEAYELRDGDSSRYHGKGVQKSVKNVNEVILERIQGMDIMNQVAIDDALIELDGTKNKSGLGANPILAVSLAASRAAALDQRVSLVSYLTGLMGNNLHSLHLPIPMMNVINGGKHADSGISTQEFMLVPHGALNISNAVRMGAETYQSLKDVLEDQGHRISVGDEGGFAPQLRSTEEALEILCAAIIKAGYQPGVDISIALDFAANDFYKDTRYHFEGHQWSSEEMVVYCAEIVKKYPIVSIEDGLSETDWEAWPLLTKTLRDVSVQCVGDDIFVTNTEILKTGIQKGVADAILIKPNQIGTLTETFETIKTAKGSGYKTVMSHRSGETTDDYISDLAVATNIGQMKSGAPARGERVAKYNQLIRLSEEYPDLEVGKKLYRF